jgi:hypothetical protein
MYRNIIGKVLQLVKRSRNFFGKCTFKEGCQWCARQYHRCTYTMPPLSSPSSFLTASDPSTIIFFIAMKRLKKELEEIQTGCTSLDESRVAIAAFPLEVIFPPAHYSWSYLSRRTTFSSGTLP